MQCLYLLLLVAVSQGFAVQKLVKLPRPDILSLTALDPPSMQVTWSLVKSSDEKNPVIGYKIKVWELKPITVFKYIEVDGVKKLVEEIIQPKMNDETPPEKEAKEIIVPDPLVSKALIPDLKLDVINEVRVRAFTKTQDGPLSAMMRLELHSDDKPANHDNDVYKFD